MTHEWTIVDNTAPTTEILTRPAAEILLNTPALFTFRSNEAASTFECSLDGATFQGCAAPPTNEADLGNLAPASTRSRCARSIRAGNVDGTPESYTFTVVGPPTTTITGPAATTESTSAEFTFSADHAGATFLCSLDGAPLRRATSPVSYSDLTEGNHTFEVQATTRFAGVDLVEDPPAEPRVDDRAAADTTAPETTIDAGPQDGTTNTTARFTFSSNEAEATFECSLDGDAFAGCSSPHEYAGPGVGAHTFAVRAIDAAGNVDATPASRTWTIDEPPPPNTETGTNVTLAIPPATVTFAEVTADGITSVAPVGNAPALPAGYLAAGAGYYDIDTTAPGTGPVTSASATTR